MIALDVGRIGATAFLLAGLAIGVMRCDGAVVTPAFAHDDAVPYADWMMSLRQPDYPMASCCGPSDQVYADSYQPSTNPQNPGGFTAVVNGAQIDIPASKIIWDRVNPTGRGVLFMTPVEPMAGDAQPFVFCFVPGSGA